MRAYSSGAGAVEEWSRREQETNRQRCDRFDRSSTNRSLEIVQLLLSGDAAVDQATTDDGTTPLMEAAQHGHVEVTQLLLEKGAEVNQRRTNNGIPHRYWMQY
jgi:ankyrin repeat protein